MSYRTMEDIDRRFTYQAPDKNQVSRMVVVRDAAKDLATQIMHSVPEGPDRTASLRKLHEAVMTANLGIMFEVDE